MVDYRNLRTGDVLPPPSRQPIFADGPGRWHALLVKPQREDEAEAWLALRGVDAFHPVRERKMVRCGKVRVYQRRYLPGYVFARFKGDPIIHAVLACPFITGAIARSDGEWGILEPSKMAAIHAMRKVDAASRKARNLQKRRRNLLLPGDAVLFRIGPLAEVEAEVVSLVADGGVEVRFSLFGREALVTAAPEAIERRLSAA